MNPTIKLQENGTVTVTDTETTTTLSKSTVDEICRLVKEDGEKVKKPNLQLGKWYKVINLQNGCLGFPDIGFFTDEKHTDGLCGGIDRFNLKTINGRVWRVNGDFAELPPETVQQYLTDEFIRLGGKVGAKVGCLALKESIETITSMDFYFEQSENCLWVQSNTDCSNKGACIFDNGKFATIIKPKTITRAEAENQTVFVVRHKETGNDFGTFSTREKAEKYISTSSNFIIVENSVN